MIKNSLITTKPKTYIKNELHVNGVETAFEKLKKLNTISSKNMIVSANLILIIYKMLLVKQEH